MAVWTAPTTRSTGALVSASIWNTDIVENLKYLKDSPVFDGSPTVNGRLKAATTMSVGNATPSTSGAGITFPAAQSASSDANTLDDYEEGTFTVTLKGSTSDPTTPVTTTARYTKIGRQVTVTMYFSNVNTTGAAGNVTVSGLLFANGSGMDASGAAWCQQFNFNSGTSLSCYLPSGSSTLNFYTSANNAGAADLLHNAGTSRFLNATITYFI